MIKCVVYSSLAEWILANTEVNVLRDCFYLPSAFAGTKLYCLITEAKECEKLRSAADLASTWTQVRHSWFVRTKHRPIHVTIISPCVYVYIILWTCVWNNHRYTPPRHPVWYIRIFVFKDSNKFLIPMNFVLTQLLALQILLQMPAASDLRHHGDSSLQFAIMCIIFVSNIFIYIYL